ncbi:DUF3955 domain-containing protein [Marilutibacter spongiae]|uniref:DUF3955 domain-containing protein n=1 Tax=Marilutibacter spongiae TaxID=2025720 RepID=A0A7W3TKS0_9GAMM|nr:DUF3955 domain-containing protein [Lysobacter spongiae]MBB1060172.1 DUF3955 domain-containing protein [Lysobacter spongiae]
MYRLGILAVLAGVDGLVAFRLIGGQVGPDGVLHEPFALVPLGCLAIVLGAALLAGGWVRSRRAHAPREH